MILTELCLYSSKKSASCEGLCRFGELVGGEEFRGICVEFAWIHLTSIAIDEKLRFHLYIYGKKGAKK